MPGRIENETLLTKIEELERRLRNLESSPQAPRRSQRGGSFRLIPADGNPAQLLYFGDYEDGDDVEQFGIAMYDKTGQIIWATSENQDGIMFPGDMSSWIVPTPQSITSATFVPIAEMALMPRSHSAIYATAAIIVPVGTTAEVRVGDGISSYTSTITVPSGGNGNVILNWKHPFGIGWDQPSASALLGWQVRRASGAGTITCYPPRGAWWTSDIWGATTSPGLSFV